MTEEQKKELKVVLENAAIVYESLIDVYESEFSYNTDDLENELKKLKEVMEKL